jgi:hypothetical protein
MRQDSGESKVAMCRECYDQAVRVWTRSSSGFRGARWGNLPSEHVRVAAEKP